MGHSGSSKKGKRGATRLFMHSSSSELPKQASKLLWSARQLAFSGERSQPNREDCISYGCMALGFLGDLIGVLEALLTCHGLKCRSSTVSQGQQSMNITLDLTQVAGHTAATVLLAKHTSREVSKGWKKQQS